MKSILRNRLSRGWLILTAAFALHIIDEATTGFLPFYNDLVLTLRENLGFFPMPTFEFAVWIGLLISGLIVCILLTPLIARAKGAFKIPIAIFAVIMTLNGCGHIGGSIYFGRILPGFSSSFLLIPGGIYLLAALFKTGR